jgi:hypothetical protein
MLNAGGNLEGPHTPVTLPERERHADYSRGPVPKEMYVPSVY